MLNPTLFYFFKKISQIFLSIALIIVTFFTTSAEASINSTKHKSVYAAIKEQYVKSVSEKSTFSDDNEDADEQDKPQKSKVSIDDYKKLLFDIFTSNENHRSANLFDPLVPISNPKVWEDLNFFCGSTDFPRETVLSRINRCKTLAGEVVLARMLATPTTDIEFLKRRQEIIKTIADNDELYENLKKLLTNLKNSERSLYNFWLNNNEGKKSPLDMGLYFKPFIGTKAIGIPDSFFNKTLNKSNTALRSLVLMNRGSIAGTLLFASLGLLQAGRRHYNTVADKIAGRNVQAQASTLNAILEQLNLVRLAKSSLNQLRQNPNLGTFSDVSTNLSDYVYPLWFLVACYMSARSYSTNVTETESAILYATKRLTGIANFIRSCAMLHNNISIVPELSKNLDQLPALSRILDKKTQGEDLKELYNLISSEQFNKEPQYSSWNSGKVLHGFKLVHDIKNQFNQSLESIGEIDAIFSLATLVRERKDKEKNIYCYAQYVTEKGAYLKFDNCWNPFMYADKAVSNSLELGSPETGHSAILSGPNAGGKSTYMKSAMTAAIFAQTFTIVPAESAELSVFSYFDTYICVQQDAARGFSQYRAEIERVKTIHKNIKMLAPCQYNFTIADEMLSGTNAFDATDIAQATCEEFTRYENSLWLIATHFPEVTELAQTTGGYYKNYKVLVNRNSDGSFAGYPFKIEPGITTESTAFDVLRIAGFDQRIIKRAEELRALKKERRESFKTKKDTSV